MGDKWREERQRINQPDKRHGRPWRVERQWHGEWQRFRQMGCHGLRRGNISTSRTRGARGDVMEGGMTRGNSVMRGRVSGRWEVAMWGEAMQQPARLEGGNATTSWMRVLKEVEQEVKAQPEERPRNGD
jgi:hypothetical protein